MNVLDLFSGIGGFSLGLERAGMRTVAFCEIDPYCQAVLRKHWPDVPVFGDVREFTLQAVADAISNPIREQSRRRDGSGGSDTVQSGCDGQAGIDVICGGFPCQDISVAGKGAGIEGPRSGLWAEYARIIGEVLPRYVLVENVAALLGRGLGRVLGDLAALGYDAEWHCIPASAVGAPHRRDRIWIVAYAYRPERWPVDSACRRVQRQDGLSPRQESSGRSEPSREDVANTHIGDRHGRRGPVQMGWGWRAKEIAYDGDLGRTQWRTEPNVGRVAHGIPNRVDRLKSLGNAIVPQISEIIGRAIMALERHENDFSSFGPDHPDNPLDLLDTKDTVTQRGDGERDNA